VNWQKSRFGEQALRKESGRLPISLARSAHHDTQPMSYLQWFAGNAAVSEILVRTGTRANHERGRIELQRQNGSITADASKLCVNGVVAAGGPLSPATISSINSAAATVPARFRRFVAYETYVKVGGSLAWRANNPGNLRSAATSIAKVPGASGTFAVFATMDEGRSAQRALYMRKYKSMTIREAVGALTPPSENDTAAYLVQLEDQGIDLDATVESQIDALMSAIEANEGMIEGVLIARPAQGPF